MPTIDDVLARIPEEHAPADPAALEGRVTGGATGTDGSPADGDLADGDGTAETPEERAATLLTGADELELLTPVVSRTYVEALQQRVLGGGSVHAVATGDAAESLRSGSLSSVRPLLAMRQNVTIQLHEGDAPFAVLVRPDRVAFGIPDESGELSLLYESEGEAARAWARAVLEEYREEAATD